MDTVTGIYTMSHLATTPTNTIHKALMAALPATDLNRKRPRAHAQLLWARHGDNLIIRAHKDYAPMDTPWFRRVTAYAPDIVPNDTARYRISVAALTAAPAPAHPQGKPRPRGRRVAVKNKHVAEWLSTYLELKELDVHDIDILSYTRTRRDDRGGFTPLLTFEADIDPSPALTRLWSHGLGREKTYGAGLIAPVSIFE